MSLYYLNLKDFQYTNDKHNSTFCNFNVTEGRCYFVYTISSPITALYSRAIIRKFRRLDYSVFNLILNPNQQQLT